LSVFIALAYQESKQKSDRVADSWARRRKRVRESGALLGGAIPAWIRVVNGGFQLIAERAAAIRRIFQLVGCGLGQKRIVQTLTLDKVPALGEGRVNPHRVRSKFAGYWTNAYVGNLLTDRRLVGEFQPMKNGKADGDVIPDYFPAVLTETEFAKA